jgi:hypothetical protein
MAVVFENKTPRGVDPRGVIFYRASYLSLLCASTEETDGVTLDDKFLCFMPASPDKIARVEIVNRMLYAASSLIEDESDCLFHILRDILSANARQRLERRPTRKSAPSVSPCPAHSPS